MSSILLATADATLRARVCELLHTEGAAVHVCSDWTRLCQELCAPGTRLALVDAALPHLDAALLGRLTKSLAHRPQLRAIGELPAGAGIVSLPAGDRAIARMARWGAPLEDLAAHEARALRWMGIGLDPTRVLARLASAPVPVLLHGERGTGKERVAQAIRARSGHTAALVTLEPEARALPQLPAGGGTLYLPAVQQHPPERVDAALRAGWRVIAGSRLPETPGQRPWASLYLPPLRERPDDLRGLATHYLERHAARLGLGRRRLERGTWALLHAHRWPENARELEHFLVELLVAVPAARIGPGDLPAGLRARLEPRAADGGAFLGFEEAARAKLAPAVAAWTPDSRGASLHARVADATDRALLRLTLARTEGNRKAAATLLGLSRNTLYERIVRLGLDATRSRGGTGREDPASD